MVTFTGTNGNTQVTTFNADGSTTERITEGSSTVTITTTFNSDGSITEVIA